jgi:DNA polymerase-4
VKLKTASFQLMTRQALLAAPTDVGRELYEAALPLLDHFPYDEPFRLIGLAAYDLLKPTDPQQLELFDPKAPPREQDPSRAAPDRRRLEVAVDAVRQAFGDAAIVRAERLGGEGWQGPNLDFVDGPEDEEAHWELDEGWVETED